jgi:serine/threonine-protein phosphatase 2B catalytic subunit
MDHDSPEGAPGSSDERRNQQVDNAIRAIQQKKPRPEIDFTIHVMEDGSQVSTQERVCKGMIKAVPEGGAVAEKMK